MTRMHDRFDVTDHEPDEGEYVEASCEQCGGPVISMGFLGNTHHGRCKNCGWTQVIVPREE